MPSNAATALQIDRTELLAGQYRPIRPLGAGGSGQVWLALDEDSGREVALKIVPRQGRAMQRAEREAEAVSRLHHPCCARSLTLTEDDEHVYLVYEYIPGKTLRETLRSRKLTDAQVVEVGVQLLEALDHSHEQGIVHRDVKPTNVILEDGPGLRLRLLDFGLALIDDDDPLTAEGDVPGTLAYIAPERLDGTEATEAADVWAAGLVLWEGLCGRHPFFGEPNSRTAERILKGPGSVADERPELPPALIRAVDGALSLDATQRPSALELAAQLREVARLRRRRRHEPPQRTRLDRREAIGRAAHAAMSAAYVAAMLLLFSFLPQSFTLPVAMLTGAASFVRPRFGLALALALPILPLGDVSIGLAIAYAAAAACWFYLHWHQPRAGAAFVLGPVLGAVGLLALVAFGSVRIIGALQRGLAVVAAVAAGVAFAGLRGASFPFVDTLAPAGLGISGSESPTAVAAALAQYAWSQPALLTVTGVLTIAAVLSPLARRATLWQLSLAGSMLVAAVLLIPTLALGADVRPGEVVVAVVLGIGVLSAPALAAIRAQAPAASGAATRRLATLRARVSAPFAAGNRRLSPRADAARPASTTGAVAPPSPASVSAPLGPIVTDPVSLEEAWSQLVGPEA